MYEHSVKAADAFDSETFLYNQLVKTFKKEKELCGVFNVTQEEMEISFGDCFLDDMADSSCWEKFKGWDLH